MAGKDFDPSRRLVLSLVLEAEHRVRIIEVVLHDAAPHELDRLVLKETQALICFACRQISLKSHLFCPVLLAGLQLESFKVDDGNDVAVFPGITGAMWEHNAPVTLHLADLVQVL